MSNQYGFKKANDIIAAKQLGLEEGHEVFFGTIIIDFIDDEFEEMIDDGFFGRNQIEGMIAECTHEIRLPKGFMLVGMMKPGSDKKTYGIVNFQEQAA